jgi:hypothetical protein
LGFYCKYYYGHANKEHYREVPQSFRGIDFVLCSSFCAIAHLLCLEINIRVILGPPINTAEFQYVEPMQSPLEPGLRREDVVPLNRLLYFLEVYGPRSSREHVCFYTLALERLYLR